MKDSFVKSIKLRVMILKLHSLSLHEAQHSTACLLDILAAFLFLFCSLLLFFTVGGSESVVHLSLDNKLD